MQTVENNSPDWESIKNGYIAGTQSVRALARENGLSDTAIHKKAKQEGWPKPESNRKPGRKPKRKPRELVVYTPPTPEPETPTVDPLITQAAAANHGELVKESRAILELLAAELRAETVNIGWLEEVIEAATDDDKDPRRYNAMMKAVSLPVRILAAKNLALALKTLNDTGPGKKEQAEEDAKNVGGPGSGWGEDLNVGGFGAN